jgi:hypothetical protein
MIMSKTPLHLVAILPEGDRRMARGAHIGPATSFTMVTVAAAVASS